MTNSLCALLTESAPNKALQPTAYAFARASLPLSVAAERQRSASFIWKKKVGMRPP